MFGREKRLGSFTPSSLIIAIRLRNRLIAMESSHPTWGAPWKAASPATTRCSFWSAHTASLLLCCRTTARYDL